jgi:hypothetical protein
LYIFCGVCYKWSKTNQAWAPPASSSLKPTKAGLDARQWGVSVSAQGSLFTAHTLHTPHICIDNSHHRRKQTVCSCHIYSTLHSENHISTI